MRISVSWLVTKCIIWNSLMLVASQRNLLPKFVSGGDLSLFSIKEDTPVGAKVYKLMAADPEHSAVYYSISGEYFSVNKHTGELTLIKPLDREANDTIEVIISVTDESLSYEESNTASLRRAIKVLDVNDNAPKFDISQYTFSAREDLRIGSTMFSSIHVTDQDTGLNSMIRLSCMGTEECEMFSIDAEQISDGVYKGRITLEKPLNYEYQSSYVLTLKAEDSNPRNSLSSKTKVIIEVEDVQDEPPTFINAPYSIQILENAEVGTKVLSVAAKDGDAKSPRSLIFNLDRDILGYFRIVNHNDGNASILTSDQPIDREHLIVTQMGGIYTFYVKAIELIDNVLPGDEVTESVTVIVQDDDDQLPVFNKPVFHLNVSEDISNGSPLPSLGMVVTDSDTSDNARFSLSLRTDSAFTDSFSIEPTVAIGRAPVTIRVVDNSKLDYESEIRNIKLYVVAFVTDEYNIPIEVSKSLVIINVMDANDNPPKFLRSSYFVEIWEDSSPGSKIEDIVAVDLDSGAFSEIQYSISGFGMEKFKTHPKNGGLFLNNKVDFEQQASYSLTLVAKDGGNRTTSVNVQVNILDVNDNAPIFEFSEYTRNIREESNAFQPNFFVKAADADGPNNNKVTYFMVSSNSESIGINSSTGELFMLLPANSQHTTRGQYELKIRANDSGVPSLFADTSVTIRVGLPGNQRPIFKGTPYNVTIPETLPAKSFVTTVRATDPDGPDELLEYRVTSGADNFYIDSKTGSIFLSETAHLDGTQSSLRYDVTVIVTDSGTPYRETALAVVSVYIADVNDKPPRFQNRSYVAHVQEETAGDFVILQVTATDPDNDSKIAYSLIGNISLIDKRGFSLKNELLKYDQLLNINSSTGEITLQKALNYKLIHIITATVEARDVNAIENVENQVDTAEVTIFVEADDELRPSFITGGWTRRQPVMIFEMLEESPIGSNVLTVKAIDPLTSGPITIFNVVSLPRQFSLDTNGNFVLTERIDYETFEKKKLSFSVEAISFDYQRKSEATVIVNVLDINDHAPQFEQRIYQGGINENVQNGTYVLTVKAVDNDLLSSPFGYGNITYHLTGEHSFFFEIGVTSGEIKVKNNIAIDREKQTIMNLLAVAMDTPSGRKERRKSEVPVKIDILDVNDNAPTFLRAEYSAVILENVEVGVSVVNVTAIDLDIGSSGNVNYEITNELDGLDLFKINSKTGEVVVQKQLTGRGRTTPYGITVRAQDGGVPPLFSDVSVSVLIGDIVPNDGIPLFLHPTEDEIAEISEDAPIGSPVFLVVASDPDDPFTPEGRISYYFLQDNNDVDTFSIDKKSGMIITKKKLDREVKSKYSIIILIKDDGHVPQQSTRILQIHVKDVDDNPPLFNRTVDEKPLLIEIKEEMTIGTVIGHVQAFDPDVKENAEISYLIIAGNEDSLYDLSLADNVAYILVNGRLDREKFAQSIITIKCYRKKQKNVTAYKSYSKTDLSELQVVIRLLDIDDNTPEFNESDVAVGVRFNTPIDAGLLTVTAVDMDPDALPVVYAITNCSYFSQDKKLMSSILSLPFWINNQTGEIRSNSSLNEYSGGYFMLQISATTGISSNNSFCIVKIYIVRDRELLKFVFNKSPTEVNDMLNSFKREIEKSLPLPSARINIFESQFHAKDDGSLDFSKTTACFQLLADDFKLKETEEYFKSIEANHQLEEIYEKYGVQTVQRCGNTVAKASFSWVQLSLLSIAVFIGITSVISSCILHCSYNRWQRMK